MYFVSGEDNFVGVKFGGDSLQTHVIREIENIEGRVTCDKTCHNRKIIFKQNVSHVMQMSKMTKPFFTLALFQDLENLKKRTKSEVFVVKQKSNPFIYSFSTWMSKY